MVDDTDYPKRGKWNGLITTNRKIDFFEAYRIYSMRWSLEVVFKESKHSTRVVDERYRDGRKKGK